MFMCELFLTLCLFFYYRVPDIWTDNPILESRIAAYNPETPEKMFVLVIAAQLKSSFHST